MQSGIDERVGELVANRVMRHSTDWIFSGLAQPTIVAWELQRWIEIGKAVNRNSLRSYTTTLKSDMELLSSLLRTSGAELTESIKTAADIRDCQGDSAREMHAITRYVQIRVETLLLGDLFARDVVSQLTKAKVGSTKDFEWYCQLKLTARGSRCVFLSSFFVLLCLVELDTYLATCFRDSHSVKLCVFDASIAYGYEYQGNFARLVITPLTERAFRSIACAMSLFRGSALSGPAGTGKTETVRDFGRAVGANCVICNCSEGLHYGAIVRVLRGVCQTGAWGCFDECNRMQVGVLSTLGQVRWRK